MSNIFIAILVFPLFLHWSVCVCLCCSLGVQNVRRMQLLDCVGRVGRFPIPMLGLVHKHAVTVTGTFEGTSTFQGICKLPGHLQDLL